MKKSQVTTWHKKKGMLHVANGNNTPMETTLFSKTLGFHQ